MLDKLICKHRIEFALDIVRRAKILGDYDSNVIGMAAEIIAEEKFGMEKTTAGTKDIDGYFSDKKSVQVKGWSCSRINTYGEGAFFRLPINGSDKLLVILIYSSLAEYEVLYNGYPSEIGKIAKLNGKEIRIIKFGDMERKCEIMRKIKDLYPNPKK